MLSSGGNLGLKPARKLARCILHSICSTWVKRYTPGQQYRRQWILWTAWVHELSSLESIDQSCFVQATVAGLNHSLAKPKTKKELVTVDMLPVFVASTGQSPSRRDVRLAATSLLVFATFLHCNELARLWCCDIKVCTESMSVHITSSKTDQYWQGDLILVHAQVPLHVQWWWWRNISQLVGYHKHPCWHSSVVSPTQRMASAYVH